jgi:threonine dehydrogenase-like Zn-dependent dehydrogenase
VRSSTRATSSATSRSASSKAVGAEVKDIAVGDRVVVPFNIACGHCFMCDRGLQSQCETTQVHEQGTGAALFGYTKLYGQVPGGQADYLRVPQAHYGPIKVPHGPPDDRFVYLSDVLPTAWQAVEYADIRARCHPPRPDIGVCSRGAPTPGVCSRADRPARS